MEVEIVYVPFPPKQQLVIKQQVAVGCCVREAVEQSNILQLFPEIVLGETKVGIFGQCVSWHRLLQPYDRIEIYRPLLADPKEIRRLKVRSML